MTASPQERAGASSASDVAIIGMACRFPGAHDAAELWTLLRDGGEALVALSDDELRASGTPESLLRNPDYVKAGMFLQRMDQFDAGFFGFSPLDGRILDPQHRHFLECAWEALEDAGYDPARYGGSIGVFAGSGHNAYLPYNLLTNPQLVAEVGFFLLRHTGNDKDFLSTRVSYCFDLKGPSVNVQTACSTSLVAMHAAAQSLLNGECDMALAGGVTIELPHRQGYLYKDSEILSRDGHCRPFDAGSSGTVFGSGVGVLLLKRLDDALADGDNVHAVMKASAVNNDGAGKVSYLAPSVDGQAAVIQEALSIGDIEPQSVTYVETHGTGTQLGDPIEVAALTQAYGAGNPRKGYCAIGSIKSNIGHLDTAAGVASAMKVILALKHRQLPPTLHFRAPNPVIDFANSPFFVNAQLRNWDGTSPLRGAVSSLGVGGTNAHIILEEAPAAAPTPRGRGLQLLLLSARTESSLARTRDRMARFLEGQPPQLAEGFFPDATYTLAVGRRAFRRRAFVIASDPGDAISVLDGGGDRDRFVTAEAPASSRKAVFMFAGGGAQYANMGRGLYESEPAYRAAVDECLELLRGIVDFDIKPLLYPPDAAGAEAADQLLERPSRTLPALFVTQYAQARLWQSWGVKPSALIGHSMGENTAACVAGVLSVRDALGLVALRGKLFETVGEGSMMSVELDEKDLLPLLGPELSIAAINAPGLAVASGPKPALLKLEKLLTDKGVGCKRIRINVAAHSSMLEGILKPFGDYWRSIKLSPPKIPIVSNVTGDWLTPADATDPEYWVRHLRRTVRFADGAGKLLESRSYVLVEVGPGRTLASLAGLHASKAADQAIVTSLRHPDDQSPDQSHMLAALGRVWQAGVDVDWNRFYEGQGRRRVSLPTYAFDHARCWVEPGTQLLSAADGRDGGERGKSLPDWLYQPVWHRSAPLAATELHGARVLVLAARHGATASILAQLKEAGADVRTAREGARFSAQGGDGFAMRWGAADDYVHLVDALQKSEWIPTRVLHLLSLDVAAGAAAALDPSERAKVFDSLFHLAQAAGNEDWQALKWLVVSMQAMQVGGEPIHSPLPSLALGPIRVLPHELPSWSLRLADLEAPPGAAAGQETWAQRVIAELANLGPRDEIDSVVALRGTGRFLQRFSPRAASGTEPVATTPVARENGLYVVTGGTGGLGLVAAAALCAQARVTVALLARRALPPREYWQQLIQQAAPEAAILEQVQKLEQGGARVLLEVGDVTDGAAMRALAEKLQKEHGPVRGILHCAGVVDDGLLLMRDIGQSARVLAPKVLGTVVLDQAFSGPSLDFVALYSSISSFAGLPGQIDYAAANAFQDAFAHWRSSQGVQCIAINWPAWREVGMAASLASGASARRLPAGRPVKHPLLDRCIEETPSRTAYATLFDVKQYWVLHEHRLKDGPALIPGSGFIELARAAYSERQPADGAVEITDAVFELPFIVGETEHKVLRVVCEPRGARSEVSLESDSFGDTVRHARGLVGAARPLTRQLELSDIRKRCAKGRQLFTDEDHHPFLQFGSRWQALRGVDYGSREALIELRLDDAYLQDLEEYRLHPALLDMASAGAQIIVDNYLPREELYVPIGYRQLVFNGKFPQRSFSHVVFKPAPGSGHSHEIATFDIAVCDERGNVFLEVKDFALRRLADTGAFKQMPASGSEAQHAALSRTMELGINPDEGSGALLHVLGQRLGPQTAVSPFRLDYVRQELLKLSVPEPVAAPPVHDADVDPDIPAVEAALGGCPSVQSVVVRSYLDAGDERRFVAFFVPNFDHYVTSSEVRRFARSQLPADRQPQQLVELDELPRGPGGEVDRKALRDPLAPQDTFSPPRTTTEKTLARIWQEALGVERVGLSDNFFDLGGHSLLSTRVIVQIFKRLGARLDQATMVLSTLEQIARDVDQRSAPAAAPVAAAPQNGQESSAEPKRGKSLLGSRFGRK